MVCAKGCFTSAPSEILRISALLHTFWCGNQNCTPQNYKTKALASCSVTNALYKVNYFNYILFQDFVNYLNMK